MKLRQLEWLADFILMFSVFVAGNALYKLHSIGQPLIGLVSEAIFAAAAFSLFNYYSQARRQLICVEGHQGSVGGQRV